MRTTVYRRPHCSDIHIGYSSLISLSVHVMSPLLCCVLSVLSPSGVHEFNDSSTSERIQEPSGVCSAMIIAVQESWVCCVLCGCCVRAVCGSWMRALCVCANMCSVCVVYSMDVEERSSGYALWSAVTMRGMRLTVMRWEEIYGW